MVVEQSIALHIPIVWLAMLVKLQGSKTRVVILHLLGSSG
jgi:hypothetical protein